MCVLVVWLLAVRCFAADAPESGTLRAFDVPAGEAVDTLKLAARQGGLEIVFFADAVRGVRTRALRGRFSAREALDRLVAGTDLFVLPDPESGLLTVQRRSPPTPAPNAPLRPPPSPAQDPPKPMNRKTPLTLFGALVAILAGSADAQTAPASSAPPEQPVTLSPFEVVANTRGYYGSSAMSGTRLNSNLEDIAASLTVVTKQQMDDFALLDMNDIFNYEAGTEGTGNYTEFSFNASGVAIDGSQLDPVNANRIRGLGRANITFGNFETSGQTPIDPINIDSVEIGRGPNSNIFGIGSAAGSVNTVPASANLRTSRTTLGLRVDDREGWRTSLDFNRVLRPGVLAVRGSIVHQRDGFTRKPSGVDTRRYNAMVKYRPFKHTTIAGAWSYYKASGNRPNNITPRDAITPWIAAGSPTWDPVTSTVKLNGAPAGTFTGTLPPYFAGGGTNNVWAFVDQQGLSLLSATVTTASNTPLSSSGGRRLVSSTPDPSGFLASQPLIADSYPVSGKARYDWSDINLAALNRFIDRTQTFTASIDQIFLETPRHTLAAQLAWFREANERYNRTLMGNSTAIIGDVATLQIDPNERLLDGSPNPYFLRPFINLNSHYTSLTPSDRDTYRAQLAYKLDLRGEKNLFRWLGMHHATAYSEYKDVRTAARNYRDSIISNHSWLPASLLRGSTINVGSFTTAAGYARPIQRYYLGDAQSADIDYGSTPLAFGDYALSYGNQNTGFTRETVTIGAASGENAGGNARTRSVLRSRGVVVQSHLLKDRIVTTLGRRFDQRYSRSGAGPVFRDAISVDEGVFNSWEDGDWQLGEGTTTSTGVVVKPLRWLSLHANRSDSFNPAAIRLNVRLQPLPDPSGKTEDFGFGLKLFGDKLLVRATRYKTVSINSRAGTGSTIALRTTRLDFSWATSNGFALQRQATAWVTAANPGLSAEAINQRVADIMKVPVAYLTNPGNTFNSVNDLVSRGDELEVHFNPTTHWTMKLSGARTEAIAAGVSADITDWLAERLPVWESIIDPTTGTPFWTTPYTPGGSPRAFYLNQIASPLGLEQALQGKSRPQIRKYNANFTTSFRLAGITDHKHLKRFNVGGAVRWQDKGAIGFHGVEQLPAVVEKLDANRPIYDKARFNFDAFVAYRMRLFANRVGATFQLNVRSLQENGRLQAILAGPDGKPTAYRIVDPRQFIFTATFDL